MKSEQLQEIRNEILDQLYGNRPDARTPDRMAKVARTAGICKDAEVRDFERECDYLADKDKGLLELVRDPNAKGVKSYRITSKGCDEVEQRP